MFPNLNAEEARKGLSESKVAIAIGINPNTYASKKRIGSFKLSEINKLLRLFNCSFDYLFTTAEEEDKPA